MRLEGQSCGKGGETATRRAISGLYLGNAKVSFTGCCRLPPESAPQTGGVLLRRVLQRPVETAETFFRKDSSPFSREFSRRRPSNSLSRALRFPCPGNDCFGSTRNSLTQRPNTLRLRPSSSATCLCVRPSPTTWRTASCLNSLVKRRLVRFSPMPYLPAGSYSAKPRRRQIGGRPISRSSVYRAATMLKSH